MLKHSLSVSGFYHLDILGCLKKASQLGYDGVEGQYSDLFSFDRSSGFRHLSQESIRIDSVTDKIKKTQDEYKTLVIGIHGPVVPLNDPNWHERMWVNEEAFRRMHDIGASLFTIHAGGGTVKDIEKELPIIEKNIHELADCAGSFGIKVCIESGCMPFEIRTIPDLAKFIKKKSNLWHTADLSHNYTCHESDSDPYCVESEIQLLGDRTLNVHIVDSDPTLPFCHDLPAGMGCIDWKLYLKGLLDQGFNGILCCECTPDATTRILNHLNGIINGQRIILPASTVLDPQRIEYDMKKVWGHDAHMDRSVFNGVIINWEAFEENWHDLTLPDLRYIASLKYIKEILSEIQVS